MARLMRVMLVCLVAVAIYVARASAQIPSAGGVFEACVNLNKGATTTSSIRLVSAGELCKPGETRVSWNKLGPQGLPGANGTDGTSVTIAAVLPVGNANCPAGGVSLSDGATSYNLCNGASAAETVPDGPCFSNTSTNRFIDCGNGTVTDTVTGLIWLRDAECAQLGGADGLPWLAATKQVLKLADGQCGLTDGSRATDWRLPTFNEWLLVIEMAKEAGCSSAEPPVWTDDAGTGCTYNGGSSFTGVANTFYWSESSPIDDEHSLYINVPSNAWAALLYDGGVVSLEKYQTEHVWPVRRARR